MRILNLASILFLVPITLFSQNSSIKIKPSWLDDDGKPISEFYDYFIGLGENVNLQKAKEAATADVFDKISDEIKATYNVSSVSRSEIKETQSGTKIEIAKDFEFVGTVEKTAEKITISGIKEVESYWIQEGIKYQYWVLVRKPKHGSKDLHLPLYTKDNGSIYRSIVYPGWGQMYNRQKGKGIFLLLGESICLAGVIAGQIMYNSNIDQANITTNLNREIYLDNANSWKTVRNMSGILAGAIWIYNIIDASSTSKPKLYSYKHAKKIEIIPNIDFQTCQLSIYYNFN